VACVLKLGGRFAVSDVIDEDMDEAIRADMAEWIAGALTRREFEEAAYCRRPRRRWITETHRVHDKAASAIIRARKPEQADACGSGATPGAPGMS